MVREKPDENEKRTKEYNARGERIYKNAINRENAKKQEKKAKKIDNFQRKIEKRWREVWADKEEIRTTMTVLYELSEIRRKYIGVAEEEQMSWADIRQEIRDKMKNSFCM